MEPKAYLEMADIEERHWWFAARREILHNQISSLHLPKHAEILEIGSGTGGNLSLLSGFGNVCAVETSEVARRIATEKTGGRFDIRDGEFPSRVPDFKHCFDLICLFDVLEHIDDDCSTLTAATQLLKPNGHLIISVPAYQWMWSRHDEFLHHYRRYSKVGLVEVVRAAGLRINRVSYLNMWLFPAAALVRGIDKLRGTRKATGASIPPPLINRAMRSIFASERHLLERTELPFGLSLLCIAHV